MSGYKPQHYSKRQAVNEQSRASATNSNEPWTAYEDDMIREFWLGCDDEPSTRCEAEVAEAVGRTVEACRVRAHYLRSGKVVTYYTRTTRTTTTTTETTTTASRRRPQWMDDEGLPDWYV